MNSVLLLICITVLYAGYNLFIKVSGGAVPPSATTTILATILLQLAALGTSALFYFYLVMRGGHTFSLSAPAYSWAALAGVCIGAAEIGYLYLFGGVGLSKPMAASIAIPTIVAGTVVIATVFSVLFLNEALQWTQVLGASLILVGIIVFFLAR